VDGGEDVARTESTARDVNERIEDAQGWVTPDLGIRMVCECGQESCNSLIEITVPEYERVRADPLQFAVVPDHVNPEVERVIYQTDRFVVVVKVEPSAADVAVKEDPRR
jgi:hypothetical protein